MFYRLVLQGVLLVQAAASVTDTTCGGALVNPVAGGDTAAAGWTALTKHNGSVQWDPTIAHNGSGGSLQITGGLGSWSTNLSAAGLAGKLIRLSFFRHTSSPSNRPTVVAEIGGIAVDDAGEVLGALSVHRSVSSASMGWQEMHLGDVLIPVGVTSGHNVTLSIAEWRAAGEEAGVGVGDLHLASFTCDIIEPVAARVQSKLTKVAETADGNGIGCVAYHGHPSARIYSSDVPSETTPSSRVPLPHHVRLYAGQNERVAFQVVLSGACASAPADWQWGPFLPASCGREAESCDEATAMAASVVTVREVAEIELTIATPPHGRLGKTPVYLINTSSGAAASAEKTTRTFWFKITAPATVAVGNFTTSMLLLASSADASALHFPVALEIAPAAVGIPVQPSIDIYGNIAQHAGTIPADDKTLEAYYMNLWDHRVFTGPDMSPLGMKLLPDGTVEVSSVAYERELAYIVANSPFQGDTIGSKGGQWLKIIGGQWLPPGNHAVIKNATWLGIRIFTDETNTNLTDRYAKASASFLSQAFAILKKHNVADRGMIKFFDEPSMLPETINALTAVANHIKAVAKSSGVHIRLRVSGGVPTPALVAAYSPGVWDIQSDTFEWYKGLLPAARKGGIQVTNYNNGVNLLSQPLLRTRTYFWALFQANLSGALCWWSVSDWKQASAYEKEWYNSSAMYAKSDMGLQLYGESGVLILPPKPPTTSIAPIDTLRWEQTLLGLQDYELLHALKQLLSTVQTNRSAEWHHHRTVLQAIAAGERALADVSRVTFRLPAVKPANDITYTLSVHVLDEVRRQVQDAILGLHRVASHK